MNMILWIADKAKKTKSLKSAEGETGTAEKVTATPEHKRAREIAKDKDSEKKSENTKLKKSDVDDTVPRKTEKENAKDSKTPTIVKSEKKSEEQVLNA